MLGALEIRALGQAPRVTPAALSLATADPSEPCRATDQVRPAPVMGTLVAGKSNGKIAREAPYKYLNNYLVSV
jgi:hypothetical protein